MADGGPLEFQCEADSPFARVLVRAAGEERREPLRLCRLGIALHTYADSWALAGFSGRHHPENDVEDLQQKIDGRFRPLRWANLAWDVLPDIGHAEAGNLPDLAWARWRYRKAGARELVERDNRALFLAAARAIYRRLRKTAPAARAAVPWRSLRGQVARLLANPETERAARCRA